MDIGRSKTNLVDDEEPARHFYHYLRAYPASFALFSPLTSVKTAVVFVHGFGGDSCLTWANFQLAIDDDDELCTEFAQVDLFFFDYASVEQRIGASADQLMEFVHSLVEEPDDRHFVVPISPLLVEAPDEQPIASSLGWVLPEKRVYERLVLVGHSEGGVVVRQHVLNVVAHSPLHSNADVVLFAPAIFGYAPSGLLGIVARLPGLGDLSDRFVRGFSAAYQDLTGDEPMGQADVLAPLQTETEAIQLRHRACRASILWATKDWVVTSGKGRYSGDHAPQYEHGKGHVGICKPHGDYDRPIEFLISSLQQP